VFDIALESPADETDAIQVASILIVDDDRSQRLLMRTVLEKKGFEVIEAADGEEACRLFEAHHTDLLLVDLVMPGMDGYALCRELRGRVGAVNVPIVVTTSRDDVPSIVRAYDAGATDFVPKPINWLVLSHRLRYILRASRAFAELRQSQERLSATEEEAEPTSAAKSDSVPNSDDSEAPPSAMMGVSGMISDQMFGRFSDRPSSSFEWAELDMIAMQINRLQAQRDVAAARQNNARVNALAAELRAAMIERDRLIARIGSGIGT